MTGDKDKKRNAIPKPDGPKVHVAPKMHSRKKIHTNHILPLLALTVTTERREATTRTGSLPAKWHQTGEKTAEH